MGVENSFCKRQEFVKYQSNAATKPKFDIYSYKLLD